LSAPVINPRYEILETTPGPDTPPYQFAKARDREEGRVVALQIVPADTFGSDTAQIRAFQAAVRQAQTLENSGILRVFDQGVTEDTGDLYVVREQIRGITLQERIRRIAPFTLAVATDIAQAVAEALVAAHQEGIAHGDLRPVHILLSPEGQIKTADFVYGALITVPAEEKSRAAYLAPELAGGGAATPAGDIFALGALLYEMLTGVLPLAGGTHVTSPRDVNPSVPPALDGLVQKALQPDHVFRYRSAAAMLADLQVIRDALRTGKSLAWSPLTEKLNERAPKTTEKRLPRLPAAPSALATPGVLSEAAQDMEEERYGMREREPSPLLGRVTAALIVLLVLGVIGLSWYFVKDFAEVPNDIQVPNLIGKTFDDAKQIADQQHFTLVESQDSAYSDTMPENQIYQQVPLSGRTIKAEKEVTVYRSLGPRLLTVPDLTGMTQDRANRALQQANLPLGSITQEYNESVGAGIVMHQSPDGSSKVARNTAVNFVVSKGKQPPDAPTGAAGTASGPDKADLHWDTMPRAESYTILRSLDGDIATITRGLTDTHFTDTNLKPNTTYAYTINAVNSAGESGPSDSILVTTEAKPTAPIVLPDNAIVTPPDGSGTSSDQTLPPTDNSQAGRLRQFTISITVPRRPRRTRHVQIEVQDTTGTNLVYDENHDPGEDVKVPIQAFGNKGTFRIFLDSKLVEQRTF
jgi:serine/threonine protein kinase